MVLMLVVLKKDGSWRMCVDCHDINNITVKCRILFLDLDEVFDKLYGFYVFPKIDLKSGYHEIKMREGGGWKTCI